MNIENSNFRYIRNYFANFQAVLTDDEEGKTFLLNNYFPEVFLCLYSSILEKITFTKDDFEKHERLQELLSEFELDKEAFWNLVIYLYDYTSDSCKNMLVEQPSSEDLIQELASLTDGKEKLTSITLVTESKKKLTVTDPVILKYLELEFDYSKLTQTELSLFFTRFLKDADKADARRKSSYFFANQLIKFFGLEQFDKIKRRKGASVSNKEKELLLSLLYVCKFMDNPESYLDTGYFNKLMKDYSGSEMNMSEKYEFTIPSY